ncbi:MAG TPA: NAD(P)/FAD-dependent oxidoreductase [Candidatus Polarisedimenticolia bacterium]
MKYARRIAVVGGGPAGSTCARILASEGARVELFEARGSSEKPCGGGVPAHALGEFPELADLSLGRRVVREILVVSPSGRSASISLPEGIHIFRRVELDSYLRRRARLAGAAVHETKVKAVRPLPGGWEVLTEDGATGPFDHLIGADGVRSVVRRAVAGPYHDDQLTLALYAYLPGVANAGMVLRFLAGFDGYLWLFPRTDHLSVGICATHRSMEPARMEDELYRFVEEQCPGASLSPELIRGYFIPASLEPPVAGDGNWSLIGDAAGFVDPLTREGISWAMRSGTAAAAKLKTPHLPDNLRWAHRYRRGFYRGDFLDRVARLASASAAIGGVLADLFEGHQGYRGLKRRLLLNAIPCGIQVGLRLARR